MIQHVEIKAEQAVALRNALNRLIGPKGSKKLHTHSAVYLNRVDGEISISTPLGEEPFVTFRIRRDGRLEK